MFVWALTLVITVVSPVLASAATFVTYVLVDENNILTTSRTFTVLLLFSALRFPINYTGRLIGRAAQALEAVRRISAFLDRETRSRDTDEIQESTPSSETLLELRGATFHVGQGRVSSEPSKHTENASTDEVPEVKHVFSVSDVSFSVFPGQLIAVVGSVGKFAGKRVRTTVLQLFADLISNYSSLLIGAGKSSLINGIIGEVPSSPTSVITKRGRVAFANQTPFVLNATLRDNILFGLPYQKDRFDSVLDACCLRPDIEQLAAGDLTEIGERGVTLSGGTI